MLCHPNWAPQAQGGGLSITLRTAQIIRVVDTMRDRVCVCVCFSLKRQLSFLVMQGHNMCRWCYFRSHFTLRLKGRAAIVAVARVAWHILKWPLALSLGVLTFSLTSFSCSNILLCITPCIQSNSWTPHPPPPTTPHPLTRLCFYLLCPSQSPAFLPPLISWLPPFPVPYCFSCCHLPFSSPFSPRTPMFSLCPDNNCKWSGRWFYFRNFAIIPSI